MSPREREDSENAQHSCTRLSSATVQTCQHNSNLMRQWKPVHSVQANVLQISVNYSLRKWSRTDCTDLLRKTECSGCAEDLGTTSSFLCRRCSAELESKDRGEADLPHDYTRNHTGEELLSEESNIINFHINQWTNMQMVEKCCNHIGSMNKNIFNT